LLPDEQEQEVLLICTMRHVLHFTSLPPRRLDQEKVHVENRYCRHVSSEELNGVITTAQVQGPTLGLLP